MKNSWDIQKKDLQMPASINTNYGAALALQNLNTTQAQLGVVQSRISTGLKIASAKDNAAIFAIANNQRAQVSGLDAVQSSLLRGQSVVDVAQAAGSQITDLLQQMKAKALASSDTSISTASRTALNNDYTALRDQITKVANSESVDGINLIKTGATNLLSLSDTTGTKITVQAQSLSIIGVGLTATSNINTQALGSTNAVLLDTVIQNVSTKLGNLGVGSASLQRQATFAGKLQDALTAAIGNLVDADLAKESANLQALQTKQQIGVQALSIANQSSNVLLSLFR